MKNLKKIVKVIALLGLILAVVKAIIEGRSIKKLMATYDKKIKFNSTTLNYDQEAFDQSSVALLCSSATVDFKGSEIKFKEGILDVFGRYSAIKIMLPKKWRVRLGGIANRSAVMNNVEEAENFDEGQVLNINYDLKSSALSVAYIKDEENIEDETIEEIEEVLEELAEDRVDDVEETLA